MPCEVLGAGTEHRKQRLGKLYHALDAPAAEALMDEARSVTGAAQVQRASRALINGVR